MNISQRHNTPDLAETWERFKSARGRELQNWVDAERALANARKTGGREIDQGDRLLIAEAALQTAIMDFATAADLGSDPTPTALGLLRLAEHVLEDRGGAGPGHDQRRRQRRSGTDRRRRGRPEE
jgi:hypothetical protein